MDYTISELITRMVSNAAEDYRRRKNLAARERRRACVIGETRGDEWQEIAQKLIEIDKKHEVHVALNPSEIL